MIVLYPVRNIAVIRQFMSLYDKNSYHNQAKLITYPSHIFSRKKNEDLKSDYQEL